MLKKVVENFLECEVALELQYNTYKAKGCSHTTLVISAILDPFVSHFREWIDQHNNSVSN